jgi:hypothetical protein
MGDDYTDCYYRRGTCGVYTVRLYRDAFAGEETARDSGPVSREEGDRRLELIRSCAHPDNARCRCEAHWAYFRGRLD